MIEQFLRPASVEQALQFKRQFLDEAVYFGGGSKLNATPTRTDKKIAISLSGLGLDTISWQNGQLHIGATCTLQQLRDTPNIPAALHDALGFIYSRHIRNQATIGGEIAAKQQSSALVPVLLALQAKVILGCGKTAELEDIVANNSSELLLGVILPEPTRRCATRKVARSVAGLTVLTAAVALDAKGRMLIALDGIAPFPLRLRDVEQQKLSETALEQAVGDAIMPLADLCGSVEYKRYIAGVVVADLLADCQQMKEGEVR